MAVEVALLHLETSAGAGLLRSDVVRKQLTGTPETMQSHDAFGEGLYRREITTKTYATLLEMAATALKKGRTVIVDASFADDMERQRFLQMASQAGRPAWVLHL